MSRPFLKGICLGSAAPVVDESSRPPHNVGGLRPSGSAADPRFPGRSTWWQFPAGTRPDSAPLVDGESSKPPRSVGGLRPFGSAFDPRSLNWSTSWPFRADVHLGFAAPAAVAIPK